MRAQQDHRRAVPASNNASDVDWSSTYKDRTSISELTAALCLLCSQLYQRSQIRKHVWRQRWDLVVIKIPAQPHLARTLSNLYFRGSIIKRYTGICKSDIRSTCMYVWSHYQRHVKILYTCAQCTHVLRSHDRFECISYRICLLSVQAWKWHESKLSSTLLLMIADWAWLSQICYTSHPCENSAWQGFDVFAPAGP
jgi:hypothetical protein